MRSRLEKPPVVQLAHVELLTPKPDETLWFFKEVLGLGEVESEGQSVYLRAYEDFYHHSLKITEAPQAGLGHVGWRTCAPEALESTAMALEKNGSGKGWIDGDLGHGPAYQFTTPDGHLQEILWEADYYKASPEERSLLKSRPQRRPLKGIPVRRLDHVNLLASEVESNQQFLQDELGFHLRELKLGENKVQVGSWLSVSNLAHEIAVMRDATGMKGRLHHVAFWYGYPQNIFDLADVCADYGIKIEMGPGKHGATQGYFLYLFEPGGNRIELFGDSGYLIFDPDWKTVVWDVSNQADLEKSSIWFGANLPESFYNYGTPNVKKAVKQG
ncbi:MAG TPA: catechol 2,3-dioxygenase [Bacillales bacterium]|nr:catechol 2,3-dioxygenase [Bacillales bacterium]